MTNEEMQKLMQFILEQQAQFAVNIQKLEEAQARSEAAQWEFQDFPIHKKVCHRVLMAVTPHIRQLL